MNIRGSRIVGPVAGMIFLAAASAAQEASPAATLQRMESELKALQMELVECRLEIQTSKVVWLDRELRVADEERQRLEALERSHLQEIRHIEQWLADPALPADERSELESQRADAMANRLHQIRRELEAAAGRRAALATQFQAEQQKLAALQRRLMPFQKP